MTLFFFCFLCCIQGKKNVLSFKTIITIDHQHSLISDPINILSEILINHTLSKSHYCGTTLVRCTLNHLSPTPTLHCTTSPNNLKNSQQRTELTEKSENGNKKGQTKHSQPSLASQSPSSKWAPRFLGRFSQPPNQQQQYRYETKYFSQRLDHFSFSELPNFPLRYLINIESWVGPERLGPIFFYILMISDTLSSKSCNKLYSFFYSI